MKILKNGDIILDNLSGKKHIVDYIESFDDISVIFTNETPCKCIPIDRVTKVPNNLVSEYFIRLFKGDKLNKDEEKDLNDRLTKLKPVTILPPNLNN